jgi:hypothetical protein
MPEVGAYSQGQGVYLAAGEQDRAEFFSARSSRCFGTVHTVDHRHRALVDDDVRDLVDRLDEGVHVLFVERRLPGRVAERQLCYADEACLGEGCAQWRAHFAPSGGSHD